jgi:hypothetical protein
MGAEIETKEKHGEETPRPSPTVLTQDQFLSWKRQKVSSFSFLCLLRLRLIASVFSYVSHMIFL